MQKLNQSVFIVEDDNAVRDSLIELSSSVGIEAKGYASAQAFLEDFDPNMQGCILLDIRMPGMSGLELQRQLVERGSILSVIIITGHGDVEMAVEAMRHGAMEFLQKPLRDQALLDCIQKGLRISSEAFSARERKNEIHQKIDTLTAREKQVLACLIDGNANKVIALELEISQRTVENHRAHIFKKMQVTSTTELIKLMMLVSEES